MGTRRFEDFQRELGVARNVLTQRLEHMVEHGLVERRPITPESKRCEYVLTGKGADLATVMIAMREWSNRWVYGKGKEPTLLIDTRTGKPVPELAIRDRKGKPVPPDSLAIALGPGADRFTRERFAASGRTKVKIASAGTE